MNSLCKWDYNVRMLSHKRLTMLIVSIALFMDVLDSNVLNTAVPVIAHSFNVNPIELKVALISYLLSLAIFIPMSGWVADKYGAKPIFIGAIGLFVLSSFYCGNTRTLLELSIGRFSQGIGGALMISLSRLIIARTFQRNQFVKAMNSVIIIVSLATMSGPFLGGVIVEQWSWPWIFWINIPIGIGLIIAATLFLKDTAPKNPRPFDFLGFILFAGSLAILCYSLSALSEPVIHFDMEILRFCISLLMMGMYMLYEKRAHHPIIKLKLMEFRTFRISVFGNLLVRLGFGGIPFLLPVFQQVALGFSPQESGLLLLPVAVGVIFSKLTGIIVLRKIGYRRFLLINTMIVAIVLSIFQLIHVGTSPYFLAFVTFIFGIFISTQYTAINSLAFAQIPSDELSFATSITGTAQILANTFGVAVSAILLKFFSWHLNHSMRLSTAVFHHTFFALGVLTFLSALIFIFLEPQDGKEMLFADPVTPTVQHH
ncbi:MAG: hypothetical protein ACD_70C00006G0003 [uncultured bacterium]|nr:MAG: hypothetical protein ACD_70C00006G0003 [uncultured bacterium]